MALRHWVLSHFENRHWVVGHWVGETAPAAGGNRHWIAAHFADRHWVAGHWLEITAPASYTYAATGGLELGGTALVTYRPALVGGASVVFLPIAIRPPARHYHYTATGGLELGGAATVRYRPAPAPVPAEAGRAVWEDVDELLCMADDEVAALLADGDEEHLLLLEEDDRMDVERVVTRDAEGRILKITSHERDDSDRLADQIRGLVRRGIGIDAEGRFTIPVPAEMPEDRLVQIVNLLRDRLQEGPAEGRPKILTWRRDEPAHAVATATVATRKPLGPIGFR